MKFVKGISLFLLYPCIMFGLGLYAGVVLDDYFYPGAPKQPERPMQIVEEPSMIPVSDMEEEVLTADTEYIIEEYDTRRGSLAETNTKVPFQYLGMNREAFIKSMEVYAISPPLAEKERGFLGLEVRSFSKQRVVIRMSYAYVEPTESFYLRVENNSIVVYCDDEKTVYMYTDIYAYTLPEYVRTQVVLGMFMKDEAALYHFLETYSS